MAVAGEGSTREAGGDELEAPGVGPLTERGADNPIAIQQAIGNSNATINIGVDTLHNDTNDNDYCI